MTQPVAESVGQTGAGDFEHQVRARIESLSYLPTTAAVALKFVELGKDLEAEPGDYAKVISADSSLSSKLLALANSSWAGVRSKVTTVKMAVNLLGLGTVRTLAISYCMTGLHNELRLSPEESETFWETSLSKAIAAKKYVSLFDAKLADEAFVAGLFQDFALTVMYSVARTSFLELLRDPQTDVVSQLHREREMFGIDHAEVGLALAQRMELPELFVDTIAFHHNYERLAEFVEPATLRDATFLAGLFPHALNAWNRTDADTCTAFLHKHTPATGMAAFVAVVQKEFADLYKFFNEGSTPRNELTRLLEETAREAADHTTELVGRVNELLEGVATAGLGGHARVRQPAEDAGADKLTGVLNREGFVARAPEVLARAARYGTAFGLCHLDIDAFKNVNESHGREMGDLVLQTVVSGLADALPDDTVIGRLDADGFAILINIRSQTEAHELLDTVLADLARTPIKKGDKSGRVTASAGLVYVKPSNSVQPLDMLLSAADKLMRTAKKAGGNRLEVRVV